MNHPELHQRTFLLLLIAVSAAFGWILLPFYGAVFWGAILSILFAPFFRRLLVGMRMRRNLAAFTTLLVSLVMVMLPLSVITNSLMNEGAIFFERIKSGELNFSTYFQQMIHSLPAWTVDLLQRFGLADLSTVQQRMTAGVGQAGQFVATKVLNIGQNTFNLIINFTIMLYLLFFLLRDGDQLATRIKQAIPLSNEHKQLLFAKFTTVIRATVKGNIIVAATQGALGGLIFWFLGIPAAKGLGCIWGAAVRRHKLRTACRSRRTSFQCKLDN
jgi:predicted PurR-regulated permease PerM